VPGRALAAECDGPLRPTRTRMPLETDTCPASLPALKCGENLLPPARTVRVRLRRPLRGRWGRLSSNDPAHCHEGATADDGKIGPGDCVRLVGTVTGPLIVQASGSDGPSPSRSGRRHTGRPGAARGHRCHSRARTTSGSRDQGGVRGGLPKARSRMTAARPASGGCSSPGIAATLGLENCRRIVSTTARRSRAGRLDSNGPPEGWEGQTDDA
jgi:hypothetical protein